MAPKRKSIAKDSEVSVTVQKTDDLNVHTNSPMRIDSDDESQLRGKAEEDAYAAMNMGEGNVSYRGYGNGADLSALEDYVFGKSEDEEDPAEVEKELKNKNKVSPVMRPSCPVINPVPLIHPGQLRAPEDVLFKSLSAAESDEEAPVYRGGVQNIVTDALQAAFSSNKEVTVRIYTRWEDAP